MTNIRLLALDLDGTLLGADSRVPQENARAVRLAQEAGVQVALCTGRNHTEVLTFNSQLEQSADWAVIANGAAGSPWTRRQRATSLCPTARAGTRCFAGRKETWSRRSCTTSTRRWWTR